MTYPTDGKIGVDLTATYTGTTTDGENAPWTLGTKLEGSDNTEWVFVQAGEALTQYACLTIDEDFQAVEAGTTAAVAGHMVGFAQVAFSDNDFGWVATQGTNITARIAGSCAADVQLYLSGTDGILDDTSTGVLLRGVTATTTNSTTAASTSEIIAMNPSWTATA